MNETQSISIYGAATGNEVLCVLSNVAPKIKVT